MSLHEATVLVFGIALGLESLGALFRYREWMVEVVGRQALPSSMTTGVSEQDAYRIGLHRKGWWWSAMRLLPTGYSPVPRGVSRIMVGAMLLTRFAEDEHLLPKGLIG